ncbi:tannase/feruloyl esterase family alpha/beta hydrolase [Actinomadura rugatobispora]|uniref:Tannase/feruloyl esterase family alpha/beta hydrolase n=1 Tax=Actinomadura rugatobispora TaxID=1994 RepID=A0ABW1AD31_9ACTN|nr:tannase/feruloyl esterase family alpha/beta hydrolase [Actinomadura rugatobispora]
MKPRSRKSPFTLIVLTVAIASPAGMTGSVHADTGDACRIATRPAVPGAAVTSMETTRKAADAISKVPAHCEVTLTLTHPGAGDDVKVVVWLPSSGWNGRFQGTGGGGYSAGFLLGPVTPYLTLGAVPTLPAAVRQGYAAAATDAGVGFNPITPAPWALKSDGTVNTELLTNFAHRSVHDMTVAAKQIVAGFYGKPPSYSYWNGCSNGGRQGLMEAQRHPTDYDGVVASAPATNFDRFVPSEMWPQVVMNDERHFPSSCVFKTFTDAAVAACDKDDGVADGIIDRPETCGFDPRSMIGKKVGCDFREKTLTAKDAEVVRRIWQGPISADGGRPLWYGLPKGASFDVLAGTSFGRSGSPISMIADWVTYFLEKNPSFDTSTITPARLESLIRQSRAEYNQIIGADDPDLTAFKNAGGKIITWHGQADPLIFPQGTVDYYRRVQTAMGGAQETDSFYRLFLAPGVGHCGLLGAGGPVPDDALTALVNWVEKGQAPATLPASVTDNGTRVTRDLCAYPKAARYNGQGDPKSAENYHCAT